MKRLCLIVIALMMVVSMATADFSVSVKVEKADMVDLSDMSLTELEKLEKREQDEITKRKSVSKGDREIVVYLDDECKVVYKENYIVKRGSTSYSVVEFYYTNIGKTTKELGYTVSFTQYQDGVELDWGILFDYPTETLTSVRPGVTIVVRDIAQLRNTTSDVELVVDEWLDFGNRHDDFVMNLSIR